MNKSYRSIYNESLGAWVAASEITSARGKKSSSSKKTALASGAILALGVLMTSANAQLRIGSDSTAADNGGATATGGQ